MDQSAESVTTLDLAGERWTGGRSVRKFGTADLRAPSLSAVQERVGPPVGGPATAALRLVESTKTTVTAQLDVSVSRRVTRKSRRACVSAQSPIRVLPRFLLRWLQRARVEERVGGVDLDSMSEREVERLHAGLLKLAALPDGELRALVGSLLAGAEDAQLEVSGTPDLAEDDLFRIRNRSSNRPLVQQEVAAQSIRPCGITGDVVSDW